ncbi:lipid A biosynthesis acyltransferase [Corallococcus praedator]|uniref:Lipid A biosynthesis acyltransferase n=1 Tax=Corallococcus praedator TaxID=2316724 RepID=A0ABX9Q990_9BACT|nr:lipid A biosynthesis acyltransferase [Corallococcus sp. CA047B]RKH27982.1 lipid A biosynthesis acyltransferase [Corallococcus sp. CA031C]RKH92307.1 lipid A biosynthesis acyltransferase [Corallococcus praedator]
MECSAVSAPLSAHPSPAQTNTPPEGKKPPEHLRRIVGEPPGPIVALLTRGVWALLTALSPGARDALARFVGNLAYTLGIRRKVALDNLAHAMPEKSEAERHAIARGAYITMARVVVESLPSGDRMAPDWDKQGIEGEEAWAALKAHVATGKGALLVTAHFGNWELVGQMLIRLGVPLNALVRPLKGALNTRIAENRLGAGAGLIYPKGAIQEITDAVQRGESAFMLLDQALPAKAAVFVPFFGRLASTTPAMAVAAERTGMPVFVVVGVRPPGPGARFRLEVEGPIPAPAPGEFADPITEHTARVTAGLERAIRRHPEQWLWLHRRWKVQPPAALVTAASPGLTQGTEPARKD